MDTSAVDRRVVTAQLAQVQSSLRRLEAIAQQPTDAYLADPDQFAIAGTTCGALWERPAGVVAAPASGCTVAQRA